MGNYRITPVIEEKEAAWDMLINCDVETVYNIMLIMLDTESKINKAKQLEELENNEKNVQESKR